MKTQLQYFKQYEANKLDLSLIDLPIFENKFTIVKENASTSLTVHDKVALVEIKTYTNAVNIQETLYYFWSFKEKCRILGGSSREYGRYWYILKDQSMESRVSKAISLLHSIEEVPEEVKKERADLFKEIFESRISPYQKIIKNSIVTKKGPLS